MNAQTHSQSVTTQQTALAAAMKSASDKANEKGNNVATIVPANTGSTVNQNLPMVIARVDLLGNRVLFLANTYNRDAETLDYFDFKKGSKPATAGVAYYKSTKPIKDNTVVVQMVNDYAKATGQKEIILRERLIKNPQADREEDGSISAEAQAEWKNTMKVKFKAAFDRAIDEAFANM